MKSKTQIEKQLSRKTNPELVRTIIEAKKKENWKEIAGLLSGKRVNISLEKINKEAKEGETVVVSGKILSQGDLEKKLKVVAFSFSEKAKEKILKSKGEALSILEEIKKNPEAKKVRIIK